MKLEKRINLVIASVGVILMVRAVFIWLMSAFTLNPWSLDGFHWYITEAAVGLGLVLYAVGCDNDE